jgi:ABC-type transporter Mla MlaB component
MTQTQIDRETQRGGRRFGDLGLVPGPDEPRVVDFYRSSRSPFFAAVVTNRVESWPGSEIPRALRPCSSMVTLVGALDDSTASILHACLERIEGNVVVDCSGLDAVDAYGVRALLDAPERYARTRAELTLVEAPSWLLRMLRTSGPGGGQVAPTDQWSSR